ncbi:MAG: hypothetical protein IH602_09260 [Bryobacteraceae bacterium]|nr:hypothetical protein [Bryobacteraceae bacterium]
MKMKLLAAALAALVMPAWADFSYDQVSTMTGGSMLRMMKMVPGGGKATQPQTSRILLKGNKLATVSQDSISIVDLDAETMTSIDLKDKKYSVITFAEYRQALKALTDKMSQQKGAENAQMDFDVKVDQTGQAKTIEGMATKQYIMKLTTMIKDQSSGQTVNMEMVSDMWMAPRIAGYEQVQQFYAKMAEKMGWAPGMMNNPMMMGQRGYSEAMAKMIKEASKLEGVPVFQVTSMQGPGGMPGGAGGEMPEMPNVGEAASESARRSAENSASSQVSRAAGRFGGLAGGALGGFGRRKKQEPPPPPPQEQAQAQAQPQKPSALMEVTVESRNFSTAAVDGAQFSVPAGFKQVEHDMKKALK